MFLSHSQEIKEKCWKVIEQFGKTTTLFNDGGEYRLQNNICPHQGSRIRTGTGTGLTPVCPYHAWSWNKDGAPLGSGTVGHSTGSSSCKNTHTLSTTDAFTWSGFLFSKPIPLDLNIAGDYELVEYRQDHIKASYIPIMDLFLDIDHIPVVHPKLYDIIDVPDVKQIDWDTWSGGSVQYVYDKNNNHGAVWLAMYPYTMLEWQPGAVFIMVNEPVSDTETVSHVFKYRDHSYSEESWSINEQVWETAWQQDRAQAELLEPGWRTSNSNLDREKLMFRNFMKYNSTSTEVL